MVIIELLLQLYGSSEEDEIWTGYQMLQKVWNLHGKVCHPLGYTRLGYQSYLFHYYAPHLIYLMSYFKGSTQIPWLSCLDSELQKLQNNIGYKKMK